MATTVGEKLATAKYVEEYVFVADKKKQNLF
jgi:hypothetical protein